MKRYIFWNIMSLSIAVCAVIGTFVMFFKGPKAYKKFYEKNFLKLNKKKLNELFS